MFLSSRRGNVHEVDLIKSHSNVTCN